MLSPLLCQNIWMVQLQIQLLKSEGSRTVFTLPIVWNDFKLLTYLALCKAHLWIGIQRIHRWPRPLGFLAVRRGGITLFCCISLLTVCFMVGIYLVAFWLLWLNFFGGCQGFIKPRNVSFWSFHQSNYLREDNKAKPSHWRKRLLMHNY